MQKLRLFLILFLLSSSLFAQQKTKIIVQSFERNTAVVGENAAYLRKPVFRHDNAILSCDSAILYSERNVFEAFDNVHINQADTLNIYSKRLTYDGNTKQAHLTENVRLVDNQSVLTTNILDYKMDTKIGTYVEGGKIVNKDVTLTSKNGYYFANSKDAYFRYNVVAVTPSATIKSDTLRYNTLSNWAYFYGPTNIKGKDDNLYTENGAYNTKSEYAYFGKKNLYTQDSKSLKGDSLYYNGKSGYGKAVRNIVFKDTEDNVVMFGQLGEYYKDTQRTIITRNAYVGYASTDTIEVDNKMQPDSLWLGADTLTTEMVLQQTLTLIETPVIKANSELGGKGDDKPKAAASTPEPSPAPARPDTPAAKAIKEDSEDDKKIPDTTGGTAPIVKAPSDSTALKSSPDLPKLSKKELKQQEKEKKEREKKEKKLKKASKDKPALKTKAGSVTADSLQTDSLPDIKSDSLRLTDTLKGATSKLKTVADSLKKKGAADTNIVVEGKKALKLPKKDSVMKNGKIFNPADTTRARIIQAYHNVKVYKSNMQAKADSLFYTSADSTFRWFRNPILWSESSQQTGDTIYLQLKNKKLNSVQVVQNGFIVSVDLDSNKKPLDTTKFNQVKGKLITGFFEDGSLKTLYVDGNAESIYFFKNNKNVIEKMNQTISSRIKVLFSDKEMTKVIAIKDVEGVMYPVAEIKKEPILTGFIWKPELRPSSKEHVIGQNKKPAAKPKASPVTPRPVAAKPGGAKPDAAAKKEVTPASSKKQ